MPDPPDPSGREEDGAQLTVLQRCSGKVKQTDPKRVATLALGAAHPLTQLKDYRASADLDGLGLTRVRPPVTHAFGWEHAPRSTLHKLLVLGSLFEPLGELLNRGEIELYHFLHLGYLHCVYHVPREHLMGLVHFELAMLDQVLDQRKEVEIVVERHQ